ncbi:LLM class flavin-dependent oxidoreductase [Pseudoclavibacter sp. RFBJ3]|uniref:LLM class flavin-dependent oxidoreductase n=1 Tax=unclassified Pseudoclavibacter TaxID=2615177 RepID=UPI000CE71F4A|nr:MULTISPECIES: LLM class flavin-dependent oxidoreductase [unclassified Pseudoclavibacter]PPF84357.1 LLM class flavin-dependent oxidoreductase [Pseudoclavibacter sp. RFBJ5]PPF92743.1 LLM class flavin-dependent oxidoreductase [Pseudoclavibacter sp. RFBJ3]PPF98185.1 LLM class flavin-dependent oxidoreductase [Pseudoclavibacter sp. RFBH5]PPG25255.1 LLM class flavin-dependent oxidoreductase [Pseudoclavibacter sp. RFBI4]
MTKAPFELPGQRDAEGIMSEPDTHPVATTRKRLSFLAFVEHTRVSSNASLGLQEGLELFEYAEDLGYDTGYVRHRHLETYLSSPFTFLAAVSQRAKRIRIGTSVTPLRFEQPVRLAEDAATLDLLSEGRLELGLSSGYAATESTFSQAFGEIEGDDIRALVDARLSSFLAALEGRTVATAESDLSFAKAGAELTVQPHSPGLRDRVAYGAGGGTSAQKAGARGLRLQLSTLNTEIGELGFEDTQAQSIRTYRDEHAKVRSSPASPSFASVSRAIVPFDSATERAELEWLLERDAERAASVGEGPLPFQFGRVAHGSGEQIAEALIDDAGIHAADELVIALPFDYPAETQRRILRQFAEDAAPHLPYLR